MSLSDVFKEGWLYAQKIAGNNAGSMHEAGYVKKIYDAIDETVEQLRLTKSSRTIAQDAGFVAERYHAGSFNIRAAASDSTNVATAGAPGAAGTLDRTRLGSADIIIEDKHNRIINQWGSKYGRDYKKTARYQARLTEDGQPLYGDQLRLNPSDQNEQVRQFALERSQTNDSRTSEALRESYRDVSEKSTSTISDGKIHSRELTKSESEQITQEIKDDTFDPNNHGLSLAENIAPSDIIREGLQAGASAAILTALLKAAPDLLKGIDYLIKNGKIDVEQLKKAGMSALTGAADGFFRGFLACSIQLLCKTGKLGKALINISPSLVGTGVALTIETIKNAIDVARGKQTAREMGATLVDGVAISASYLAGTAIAGAILGTAVPVIGLFLGSLIGGLISVAYNFSKNKFLSLCIENGFTFFGVVDQDYTLPEELLKEMGIDTTPLERVEVKHTQINRTEITTNQIKRTNYETVQLTIVKRGLIGVNKVGYCL